MGSKETVKGQLKQFQDMYSVDEIMAVSYIYDEEKQKRSYETLKEIADGK
jgi:alkanesulfonate monooxygenase SsuD/methylene tetrahydromethanopterin reductase-like flavin-dependent oxidoreductase (luciferase family)